MTIDINSVITISGYVAGVAGALLYARSQVPGQTISNYKDLAESQERRIKALEEQRGVDHRNHIENIKAIADLQGQIKVYKELPLQDMASAMQKISTVNEGIAASNKLILETLQGSAHLLADEKSDRRSKEATITTTISK
jgi:hypothetical protein